MGTLMLEDQHGLTISTSSTEAAVGFDRMVNAYLKYRTDASQHLARTLAADSGFGLLARGSKTKEHAMSQNPQQCGCRDRSRRRREVDGTHSPFGVLHQIPSKK